MHRCIVSMRFLMGRSSASARCLYALKVRDLSFVYGMQISLSRVNDRTMGSMRILLANPQRSSLSNARHSLQ